MSESKAKRRRGQRITMSEARDKALKVMEMTDRLMADERARECQSQAGEPPMPEPAEDQWKHATVHIVPPSAEELQAKANREAFARAAAEPKPERFPPPDFCDVLNGYPLLCLSPTGEVLTRQGRAFDGRWSYISVVDQTSIALLVKHGFDRETIEQAAWYLIHEIAKEAGIELDS